MGLVKSLFLRVAGALLFGSGIALAAGLALGLLGAIVAIIFRLFAGAFDSLNLISVGRYTYDNVWNYCTSGGLVLGAALGCLVGLFLGWGFAADEWDR